MENFITILIYIVSIILFSKAIYKVFFAPLKDVNGYVNKSICYVTYLKAWNSAIKVLEKGITDENLSIDDRNYLKIRIGIVYIMKKDYKKAMDYLDKNLLYIKNGKFKYTKDIASIVAVYYNFGEKEKARKIYQWLKSKIDYDSEFEAIYDLESYIYE